MSYKSWKALSPSFRNDCLIISPSSLQGKGVGYWLGVASKQNQTAYSIPSWNAEQVWLRLVGSGLPPGQRSHHSNDSRKARFKINPCCMHETLSVIALMRHPEIRHSSFRDVKGQGFQVNDFLYQQHQLTCTESLIPKNQEDAKDLHVGNATGQGLTMPVSGGSQVRWVFKEFLSPRMKLLYLPARFLQI